jgi:hypothetical protein
MKERDRLEGVILNGKEKINLKILLSWKFVDWIRLADNRD